MNSFRLGRYIPLLALAFLASKSFAFADVTTNIIVPNFSFEEYHTAGNSYANQTPNNNPGPTGILFDDWITTSANYQLPQRPLTDMTLPGTAQGTYYLQFDGISTGFTPVAETENPVATIDNNAVYTLTIALGNLPGGQSLQDTIELLSGNTVLASNTVSTTTLDALPGTFADFTTSFDTLAGDNSSFVGQNLSIAFYADNPDFNGARVGNFDNVRLAETTVPEPGTWAMMLLGSAGLIFLGRRRLTA
jgi:hypothetical protein